VRTPEFDARLDFDRRIQARACPTAQSFMWRVEDHNARLTLGELSGSLDLLNPAAGLGQLAVGGNPLAAAVLQVAWPEREEPAEPPLEHYVRGGDLVANYGETSDWPFRAQLYWRTGTHRGPQGQAAALAAIELVASIQTQLLDTQARLCARSRVAAREVFRLRDPRRAEFERCQPSRSKRFQRGQEPACFLLRLDDRLSYGEMVHPLDFHGSVLAFGSGPAGADVSLNHDLFLSPLEKGVILRARVLGVFLPRRDDQQALAAHYATFSAAEPPLTT
jgi:hypothetical protein